MKKEYKVPMILFSIYAFSSAALASYGPYLILQYKSIGIDVKQIGLLATVAPVASIIFAPMWGRIADKSGKVKALLIVLLIGTIASLFFYTRATNFYHFAIINLVLAIFQTSISSNMETLSLSIVERNKYDYPKIRSGGTIGYALVLIVLGSILSKNFDLSVYIAIGFYIVMLIFVFKAPEEKMKNLQDTTNKKDNEKLLKNKELIIVFVMLFLSFAVHIFNASYMALYLDEMGMKDYLSILLFVGVISELPVFLLSNKIIKKVSPMKLLFLSGIFTVVRTICIGIGSLPLIVIGQCFQGVAFILNFYCGIILVYELVPKSKKSQGQSLITVVQGGIASIAGNMLGGVFIDELGYRSSYFAIAIAAGIVTLICYMVHKLFIKKTENVENQVN